jgi:hypothetical protein
MPQAWAISAESWQCSSCSTRNWAGKHICRGCTTRKTYADIAKLGPKKPPAAPAAKAVAAGAAVLAASPTPAATTSAPTAAMTTASINAIKVKLTALQAAKLATEAAELPTQHIDDQIISMTRQLNASKPAGVQLDSLRAAIARADKRLAKAIADKEDAQLRIKVESEASAKLHADMLLLEATMSNAASTTCLPPAVASKLNDAIMSLRSGVSYQQEEMAAFLEKLIMPTTTPPPATPTPLANPTTTDETPCMPTDQYSDLSEMDETLGENAWNGPGTGEDVPTPWYGGLTAVGPTNGPTQLASPARRQRNKTYVETPQLAHVA